MPPKRPLGLKKEPIKKLKQEEEITITINGNNDFEELKELYGQAVEQLLIDVEQSKLLFRGVVHECDKLLRIVNDQVEVTEQFKKIKNEFMQVQPEFYRIYGNGLYYLSLLDKEQGFLELGLEMVSKSLELKDEEETRHSHARILIQLAMTDVKYSLEFKEEMQKEFTNIDFFLELCHYSHQYAETIDDFFQKKEWVLFNQQNWERVLNKGENIVALIGLGNGYLYLADEMIQLMEDGKDVNSLKIIKYLEQALSSFKKALTITNENPIPLYLLMGEVQVHLGNLLDKEDEESTESLGYYKEAVLCFENVQKLDKDALPLEFEDFLKQWQEDMQ
jgi:hypothetical protein